MKTNIPSLWAFTGTGAANSVAPLLTSVDTVNILVAPGHAEAFAGTMKLKPAEKGANVTIIERSGAGMQFIDFDADLQAYLASPFIIYMDLLDGRGRNKELAQYFRERLEL